MDHFEISKPRHDRPDDHEQKGPRKKPRFSPATHADQLSPSTVHEKEQVRPKGEQSAYSDVSIEDVMKIKKQKNDAYRLLDSLLEKSGQGILEAPKPERGEKSETSPSCMKKLMKRVHRYFISEKNKRLIDQQREDKVEAVEEFITHYKNIHIVLSAIEANGINKWIDSGKYLIQGNELIEELQMKMQAVHSSLERLGHLFSGKDNQAHDFRQKEIASFVTDELSKLEKMKHNMENISQEERVKKLGPRGKKALETMKKCYEKQTLSTVSDHPHTLGALENSLKDVSKKLYAFTEGITKEEIEKAKKLSLKVRKKGWDNELIIKNIVANKGYAQYASQCFVKFDNQLNKCIDLNNKQNDKESVEHLLTALKDLTGHYEKAISVKRVIELAKDLTGHHDGVTLGKRVIELAKDLTGHHDGVTLGKRVIELAKDLIGKAKELSLEVKNNEWDKSNLENIVGNKIYVEYAHQCVDDLNTQLEKCCDLFKDKKTSKEHLTALRDLTDHYNKVMTVKHVIELVQARKHFAQTRDLQAVGLVRKALEKFEPPQHLIDYQKKRLTEFWIYKSIYNINYKLICNTINNMFNIKINKNSTLENVEEKSVDNSIIVFEEGDTKVEFRQLREAWSEKEWFSKLDDGHMLDNGQIKEIVKEYYESYLKAVDKKAQDLVQEGDPQIWIRCKPETLIKTLECGRFKSQFETNTSGGIMDPTMQAQSEYSRYSRMRAQSEYGRTGIPLNMPAPFRFIYGYATINPSGECPSGEVEQFGPVAVRLKPELKKFALQMLGNSLDQSDGTEYLEGRPTFFDNADRRCFPLYSSPYLNNRYGGLYKTFEIQGREDLEKKIEYQEVQIPAVYKEDIQEVVFHTRMEKYPGLKEELIKLLEQDAISYRNISFLQKEDIFKAAMCPSYKKVLDISGKVIFTEDDYRNYQQYKEEIVAAMGKEDGVLIGSLQKISFFEDLYGMSVGVSEGHSLQEHTSMVLEQFRKYQMENWGSPLLTAKEFQLMLAIHDIGKPQAVQETGKTSMQHEYNGCIIPRFLKWLGMPEEKSKLMVALTMQDHLGGFLKDAYHMGFEWKRAKVEEVARKISAEAAEIGIRVEQYFDLITCYYRADAGSYTEDAGGKYSLDYLFEKKTAPNCTRAFSEQTQRDYDNLAEAVKSIASK